MGSHTFANELPVHRVSISAFWLARSEVTQAQWHAALGTRPSRFSGCDDCPVEQVSWDDVQKYLEKTGYRLPTEAQWEYAAGGGAEHHLWAGTSDGDRLGDYAWLRTSSVNRTHPVCRKEPNRFGVCDMSGNVYEWCADWYDDRSYAASPGLDPPGAASGTFRVARGGSWILDPRIARIAFRLKCLPSQRRSYLGFRVVLAEDP